ncbi:MAG: hypothetical protein MZV70_62315 [Desulfobacterales bacterium]|nr:hypothetical protein [Desulfobacterales bacterium]
MFSSFTETTNIRLNGVNPEMEMKTRAAARLKDYGGRKDHQEGRDRHSRTPVQGHEGETLATPLS